jgi:hypothetical protein
LAKARKDIEELIEAPGPYGHNIVSLILRSIATELGYDKANKIVEELELDKIFSIPKYWPAIDMLKNGIKNSQVGFEGPTKKKFSTL